MIKGKALVNGFLLLSALLALAGCGGGSGGANPSTPGQAQGAYAGTTSTGQTFNAVILPNDMLYAIYGSTSGNLFNVCGMATGQGASNSGKYTATANDFNYCNGSVTVNNGQVTSTYMAGSSINGSITENNKSVTF